MTARLEITDPYTKKELAEIIRSVEGWDLVESGPCSLLILEVDGRREEDFGRLGQARESEEAADVFLTARQPDPDLLIRALRAGVREFFYQPLKKEEVVEALLKLGRKAHATKDADVKTKEGVVFTVFGTKGGVGTTTIAVNLATGLARMDGSLQVALLDMNFLSGEVPLFLNVKPLFSWAEVARNASRLDATYLTSVLQRHDSGVHVLPAPVGLDEKDGLASETEKVLKFMRSMFDFVVIDGGQSSGTIWRYLTNISDKILLVAVPSLPGMISLKRLISVLKDLGCPSEDIVTVLNRHNQKSSLSPAEIREMMRNDMRWRIPNDYQNTMSAINRGQPLTAMAPNADVTKKILEMAGSLAGKEDGRNRGKRVFRGLF
jgi:pilus assembly protein CpaE